MFSISDKFFVIKVSILAPTVTSLSRKRNKGLFIEFLVLLSSLREEGKICLYCYTLYSSSVNHCNFFSCFLFFSLSEITSIELISSSFTSYNCKSKVKIREVFYSFIIFSTFKGRPDQAGLSFTGKFSIHSRYWSLLIASGMCNYPCKNYWLLESLFPWKNIS